VIKPEDVPSEVIDFVVKIMEYIAKRNNWRLSSNRERVRLLIAHLIANWANYGHPYCPCRLERIRENICPCVWAFEEIKNEGKCKCRLFYAE